MKISDTVLNHLKVGFGLVDVLTYTEDGQTIKATYTDTDGVERCVMLVKHEDDKLIVSAMG